MEVMLFHRHARGLILTHLDCDEMRIKAVLPEVGDPFFDLGNVSVNQGLDVKCCKILSGVIVRVRVVPAVWIRADELGRSPSFAVGIPIGAVKRQVDMAAGQSRVGG